MPSYTKTVNGLSPAMGVILYWRPESSETASSSTGSVYMNGTYTVSFSYEYDVTYVWSLYYYENGFATTKIDGGTVYTPSPAPEPLYTISSITHSSITLTVSHLSVGDEVKCTVYLASAEIGYDSAYATGGDVSLSVSGLDSDTDYTVTVIIVNKSKSLGTKQFTTSSVPITEDFEWDTDIRAGAIMNTYMYTGTHYPAPVTAAEWNRLVDLVNKKCGTSIGKVASGVRMYASSGGNVRRVADALGVTVDSGDIITAQFFLDLRDAVNAKN